MSESSRSRRSRGDTEEGGRPSEEHPELCSEAVPDGLIEFVAEAHDVRVSRDQEATLESTRVAHSEAGRRSHASSTIRKKSTVQECAGSGWRGRTPSPPRSPPPPHHGSPPSASRRSPGPSVPQLDDVPTADQKRYGVVASYLLEAVSPVILTAILHGFLMMTRFASPVPVIA
jgi:hypothetical protein